LLTVFSDKDFLMRRASTIDVLNQLLVLHHRSLPMYLSYAVPWSSSEPNGTQKVSDALDRLVEDQKLYSGRIADAILDRGGRIESGGFPMEFTDLHLLSLDFLLREMIRYLRRDIETIQRCVDLLDDPAAKDLAEEALGNAKGHLDTLEELARDDHGDAIKLRGSESH
jgi:hypothetical protein